MRLSEKARSRARLGADTARVWVREIRLGNPYAKAVLLAIANYMNEDGAAWPGISTIARDTDISEDTVVNRLRWCESIGVVAMFKCWVDEHGRRNYDGRGRVTSSEIRFLFDADVEAIETAAQAASKPVTLRGAALKSAQANGAASPRHGRVPDEASQEGVGPGVAPEQPPPPSPRTEELEPDSPQSPPLPDEQSETDGIPYERFAETYGEGSVRPQQARTLWAALSDTERETAIRGARGYRAQRVSAKKSLVDPERFLRNRDLWTEFANKPGAVAADMRSVPEASEEGRAIRVLWKLAGSRPLSFQTAGETMISVRGAASEQILALSVCIDDRGREIGNWSEIEVNSNAFAAWRELVTKTIGRGMALRPNASTVLVPAEFPPRADGSWPEFKQPLEKTG